MNPVKSPLWQSQSGRHFSILAEFAPLGAKKLESFFFGDMRGEKNTYQPANVNFGGKAAKTLR